jgi:ABC-type lipoprotein release transport system permease subunit
MILKLAYKNVISRRSSFVIILFVSFAVCLFCTANALFDSTEQGVQENYISSFTGDLMIRPKSNSQLSLFGDETPVTGELTRISTVVPYDEIIQTLSVQKQIDTFFSQVSGMAAMEYGSNRFATYVFGVNGDEYLNAMTSIKLLQGSAYTEGQKGVMLCSKAAEKLGVQIGDIVQFIVTDGPYVRIRAAPLTAIFEYNIHNDIFDRFAIADADTVRSLLDIAETTSNQIIEIDEDNTTLLDQDVDFDFDSLFDDVSDSEVWETQDSYDFAEDLEEPETLPEIELSYEPQVYVPSSTWNFIVVRLKDAADAKKTIKKLNRIFRRKGWPVQATDWRHAAGSTALYLHWMRIIFNIGISIVLFAGFIIVNNTLVINVLDRTQEIGTMRAIGAKKRFISLQCMAETFIMTLTSGVIGVLLGAWACHLITKANIVLHNSFLIQLFGGDALQIFVTPLNVAKMFALVIGLGIVGWIYPVINAVRVSPVRAMQGAR